jgi:hypothetical protein
MDVFHLPNTINFIYTDSTYSPTALIIISILLAEIQLQEACFLRHKDYIDWVSEFDVRIRKESPQSLHHILIVVNLQTIHKY